ncbi:Conserved hypothetical protein [gamma proteobacterium HdN1]|nr:Conserved hypothetical protein [gamma proteobacterium HdN1]
MQPADKLGLVLSGGGAKGAYHVGMVRALNELGSHVNAIAGASIGALNGCILASAPNFEEGHRRLETLWNTLQARSPIKTKKSSYLKILAASAAILAPQARILTVLSAIGQFSEEDSILSNEPLLELLEEYFDVEALQSGLPLYVSVFPSFSGIIDIVGDVLAALGIRDTPNSDFLHVQSLSPSDQKKVLMASAALPVLFEAQKVNGRTYTDGGQGGWSKSQGNTPIQPLIDAGCTRIIVNHLSDGSLWSRHDFPTAAIIEVRPLERISRSECLFGEAKDLLGFNGEKIPSWISQGYEDTIRCVGRVKNSIEAYGEIEKSKAALSESLKHGAKADLQLEDRMKKLDGFE